MLLIPPLPLHACLHVCLLCLLPSVPLCRHLSLFRFRNMYCIFSNAFLLDSDYIDYIISWMNGWIVIYQRLPSFQRVSPSVCRLFENVGTFYKFFGFPFLVRFFVFNYITYKWIVFRESVALCRLFENMDIFYKLFRLFSSLASVALCARFIPFVCSKIWESEGIFYSLQNLRIEYEYLTRDTFLFYSKELVVIIF